MVSSWFIVCQITEYKYLLNWSFDIIAVLNFSPCNVVNHLREAFTKRQPSVYTELDVSSPSWCAHIYSKTFCTSSMLHSVFNTLRSLGMSLHIRNTIFFCQMAIRVGCDQHCHQVHLSIGPHGNCTKPFQQPLKNIRLCKQKVMRSTECPWNLQSYNFRSLRCGGKHCL